MSSNCFATLTPENAAAQKCLALLVDRDRRRDPDREYPTNRFVATQINLGPISSSDRAARSKYQLLLSFDEHSGGPHDSWKFGKGSARSGDAPVDLQLCTPRSRHLKGPVLGIILINPRSGAFILQNVSEHNSIVYVQANGEKVELRHGDQHVLYMKSNHLRFGPLDYLLEFCVESEAAFCKARTEYLNEYICHNSGDFEAPCSLLDPLPKPTHLRNGDIIIHNSVSKGAFGVVRVGVHSRSGEVVACKTIHCWQREMNLVRNEITLASEIPPTSVGVVPLLYTWCEHGHSPPCFGKELEDVHLMMPFAQYDFTSAPWSQISLPTRLELFRQVLEGLRNIHSAGIMHRDISPRNSLIFSLRDSAPKAGICDFGKSKKGSRGTGTSLGPPQFTAPEVWRLQGYTNAIDVFSLGLTILSTFEPWHERGPMDKGGHEEVLEHLAGLQGQGRIPEDLGALLRSMLAWDPADRPTAEQALDSRVWRAIATATAPDPRPKRSSSDRSSESGREKRFRRSDGPSLESPPEPSSIEE